ncbi:MAG: FecR domain-containing protein [Sneathiella sp.]
MIRNLFLSIIVSIFIVLCTLPLAIADDDVGTVTRLKNTASVTRLGQQVNIETGFKIQEFDEIRSGEEARVEITFHDGTKLNIGANCHIVIDKFLFDPDTDIGIAILRVFEGPFRFITGRIGKTQDPQIVVQSRFGVIGVRGTDFWAGPSRGQYGVLLLEGAISVTNSSGQRILTIPGTGVNLTSNDIPPSEVTTWGAERAAEALAAVAF